MYYKFLSIMRGENKDFSVKSVRGDMWFAATIQYKYSDTTQDTHTIAIMYNNVPYFREKGTSIAVISDMEDKSLAIIQWSMYESEKDRIKRQDKHSLLPAKPRFPVEIDYDENAEGLAISTDEARRLVEFIETDLWKIVRQQDLEKI